MCTYSKANLSQGLPGLEGYSEVHENSIMLQLDDIVNHDHSVGATWQALPSCCDFTRPLWTSIGAEYAVLTLQAL